MQAFARVVVEFVVGTDGRARNRVAVLRSEPPLVLRPVVATCTDGFLCWDGEEPRPATVTLVAGSAGPIGGDRLRLQIEVGSNSMLVLSEVAATLVLPGPNGEESTMEIDIRVGANGTLVWLPEPVIGARGCRHRTNIHVRLLSGARLLLREELVLGRHGEQPGCLRQHLRAQIDSRPFLDQELAVGLDATGWDGPAVSGGQRALGSLLVVDPAWGKASPRIVDSLGKDAAILQLPGPAVLMSVLAPDTLLLRRQLQRGLALLDHPATEPRVERGELPVAQAYARTSGS